MKNSNEHQVPWEERLLSMDFMTKKLNGDEVSRIILFIRSHHAHLKERVRNLKEPLPSEADDSIYPLMVEAKNKTIDEVIKLLE